MAQNEIGVEEVNSRKILCELCDSRIGQYKFIILEKFDPDHKMECILCDECYEDFIATCSSFLEDKDEDAQP